MLNPINFIQTPNATDIGIVFLNGSDILGGLNVCNYLSSTVENTELVINLVADKNIRLEFGDLISASQALGTLRQVINDLFPNCALVSVTVTPPAAELSLTKIQYEVLMNSNTLVPYTNYVMTDTLGDFGEGISKVFLLQPKKNNDSFVEAKSANSNDIYILDFISDKLYIKYNAEQKLETHGFSTIVADSISTEISADQLSYVTTLDSHKITAKNSTINVSNSTSVEVLNSNITLDNVTNSKLNGLSGNLSGITLSNVDISPNSFGKAIKGTLGTANQTLKAYIDGIWQTLPTLTQAINVTLDDEIAPFLLSPKVNSKFYIKVPDGGIGAFNATIKNKNGATIDVVSSSSAGLTLEYIYNYTTGLFEKGLSFSTYANTGMAYAKQIAVSYNQTFFSSIFLYAPQNSNSNSTQMFINGVAQAINVDFAISGTDLTYLNTAEYKIEIGDVIQVYYS